MKAVVTVSYLDATSKATLPLTKDMSVETYRQYLDNAVSEAYVEGVVAACRRANIFKHVSRDSDVIAVETGHGEIKIEIVVDETEDLIDELWNKEDDYCQGPNECAYDTIEGLILSGYLNQCSCGNPTKTLFLVHDALELVGKGEPMPSSTPWENLMIYTLRSAGFVEIETWELTELGRKIKVLVDYERAIYE